jgi:hypothetical protein
MSPSRFSFAVSLLLCCFVPLLASAQDTSYYYCPERPLAELLGDTKLEGATEVSLTSKLDGLCSLHRLPNGAVVFHAKMDIDADGSPNALTIDPEYGQLTTAYTYRGFSGQAAHVDAETVPYIVLPEADDESQEFYDRTKVGLGDIAAVFYRGRMEFALVADLGPSDKIGEGSVALAQSLGHNPFVVRDGRKLVDRAIGGGVVYVVFPGSRLRGVTPENIVPRLREEGERLLEEVTAESE